MQSQACPKSEFGGKEHCVRLSVRGWCFFPLVFLGGVAEQARGRGGGVNVCVTPGNFCSLTQYAEKHEFKAVQMSPEGHRMGTLTGHWNTGSMFLSHTSSTGEGVMGG